MSTEKKPIVNLLLSEKLPGLIWKLEIDSESDLLFVEVRNKQEHQVSFTAIDLSNGKINFTNLQPEERWHTGIEGAKEGILFLHGFESALSPAHKGIIAIDAATGKTIWANYLLAVHQFTPDGINAFDTRMQPRRLVMINYGTGENMKPAKWPATSARQSALVYPETKKTYPVVLESHFKGEISGEILVADCHNLRIVSLHTLNNGLLKQHLFILQDENLIFHDLLNENIQKLQPEAFVIHKSKLIYIKNHSEIKVLNL